MSDDRSAVVNIGQASLTGWRGRTARAIAKPVSERTRFSQEQVESFFGLILLGLAVYWLIRPVVAAARR